TKKAYSPIKITTTAIENYEFGTYVKIPIYNRFDHTNLNEITISYTYNDSIKTLSPYNLAPRTKGELILPITDWKTDIKIPITFHDGNKNLIDSYRISQKQKKKIDNVPSDKEVVISKSNNMLKFHI